FHVQGIGQSPLKSSTEPCPCIFHLARWLFFTEQASQRSFGRRRAQVADFHSQCQHRIVNVFSECGPHLNRLCTNGANHLEFAFSHASNCANQLDQCPTKAH